MYGRKNDTLFIHGASVSRMVTELEKGIALSISISNVSGLVLARYAFHHSLNYESIVIFGKGELVTEAEKEMALKNYKKSVEIDPTNTHGLEVIKNLESKLE